MLPCGDYTIWSTFVPAKLIVTIWKLPMNSLWSEKAYEQFKSSFLKLCGEDGEVNPDWDLTFLVETFKKYFSSWNVAIRHSIKQEGRVGHCIVLWENILLCSFTDCNTWKTILWTSMTGHSQLIDKFNVMKSKWNVTASSAAGWELHFIQSRTELQECIELNTSLIFLSPGGNWNPCTFF